MFFNLALTFYLQALSVVPDMVTGCFDTVPGTGYMVEYMYGKNIYYI